MLFRNGNQLQLNWLLEVAGVSKSGFYEWKSNAKKRKEREKKDRADFDLILKAFKYRGYDKGARGIYMRLQHDGKIMNIKKIRRLMKKYGLICPIRQPQPYRQNLRDENDNRKYDNILNRNFRKYGPRTVLLTDITYLYYYNGQRCFLSAVKDAYTGECLAHMLSSDLKLEFVLKTFSLVAEKHGDEIPDNALVHSDQGAHYLSVRFSKFIDDMGFARSMSKKANCWDNAPQESFFGHMKDEIGDKVRNCTSYSDVKAVINDWMDYYNNERPQWNLAKLTPREYYEYCNTGVYPLKELPKNAK